jgi:hypothetical protein
MFGSAALLCASDWNCDAKAAPKSSRNPVYSTPGAFGVSKMFRPRRSVGRKYYIVMGRTLSMNGSPPFSEVSSAAGAGVAFSGASLAEAGTAFSGGSPAEAGSATSMSAASAMSERSMRIMGTGLLR